MQRSAISAMRFTARRLSRFLSSETNSSVKVTQSKASAGIPKTGASKAAEKSASASGAVSKGDIPKGPKTVKTANVSKKSGKGKRVVLWSTVVVLGAGGLYRYHTNTDHLACINTAKGGNNTSVLQTLYLVPKHLEDEYEDYSYQSYVDRLIDMLLNHNPKHFETMQDVIDFFGRWFTTIGIDVDMKQPMSEAALEEMFLEFSKQENMFNLFIIGEHYFNVSPMTDYMLQTCTRYFDCEKKKKKGQFYVSSDLIKATVMHLQEKTKETYYASGFIPNMVNKLFSSECRSAKKVKLMEAVEQLPEGQLGIYDFIGLMGIVERQHKDKKFYFYVENYINEKINESIFDHDQAIQDEEEEEEEEEEVKEVEEVVEEVEEVRIEEKKEITVDSLLSELHGAQGRILLSSIRFDCEGLNSAVEEERTIRKQLKEMEWW